MTNEHFNFFIDRLTNIVNNEELIKLVISKKRRSSSELRKITVTIVSIKKGLRLNFVYTYSTKDITKNYNFEEGIEIIADNLTNDFYNADVFAKNENIGLISSKKGNVKLLTKEPSFFTIESLNHDKNKKRYIQTNDNIYLRELGITKPNGEVFHKKIDKYKQINRYVELLAPKLKEIPQKDFLHIVDMGSGKGYLTFALYDYLKNKLKINVKMTGVEYREGLVKVCNEIAHKAGYSDLSFVQGTIQEVSLDKIDVLIALHACDTATDDAIYRGITSKSSLIVCAPCCHKQVRMQMSIENEINHIVKHGILKERQAEIITDTLRAMIMEAYGYKTSIFEFITTDHTPKNLMIVGKRTVINHKKRMYLKEQINSIKKLFGLKQHYLEKLMNI